MKKLRAEGYRYLNVTIPHKLAAARFADRHVRRRCAGRRAANTLLFGARVRCAGGLRVRAENTDGAGLIAALADLGSTARGSDRGDGGAGARRRGRSRRSPAPGPAFGYWPAAACGRGAPSETADEPPARVTALAWTGPELARALEGADVLVSAVPAAAWARRERRPR